MKDYTLIADFRVTGIAWFKDSPQRTYAFDFAYFHQGLPTVTLTASGGAPDTNIGTLYAVSHDMGSLTLYELTLSGEQTTWSGSTNIHSQKYIVQNVVAGTHLPVGAKFRGCRVRFTHMDEWIRIRDIGAAELPCGVAGSESIYIAPVVSRSASTSNEMVSVHWEWRIDSRQPYDLRWWLARVETIQKLMTLLIGRATYAESMVLFDNDSTEPWKVFFPTIAKNFQPILYPTSIPVPFSEFAVVAHTSVPKWLRVAEDLKSTVDLHWSTVVHPNQYAQLSFLSMVLALEAYHRLVFGGQYMDNDEYKAAIGDWQAHIPKTLELSHRQSLGNRIKFGNEYSLRKRLTEVLRNLPDAVRERLLGGEPLKKFVDAIIEGRNSLVHEGTTSVNVSEIIRYKRQLSKLLWYLFLGHIDLPRSPAFLAYLD